MKNKNGYLLIESVVSLTIILSIVIVLYSLMILCMKTKTSIEDKIEIQQQSIETSKHIKSIIEKSKGIIEIDFNDYENISESGINFGSVDSIKCKYKSDEEVTSNIKNKEISFKKNLNKIFINTLNSNNQSEVGGYEIGNYIENIYAYQDLNKKFKDIKLKLSKNNQVYETKFKIYIRNFEGA